MTFQSRVKGVPPRWLRVLVLLVLVASPAWNATPQPVRAGKRVAPGVHLFGAARQLSAWWTEDPGLAGPPRLRENDRQAIYFEGERHGDRVLVGALGLDLDEGEWARVQTRDARRCVRDAECDEGWSCADGWCAADAIVCNHGVCGADRGAVAIVDAHEWRLDRLHAGAPRLPHCEDDTCRARHVFESAGCPTCHRSPSTTMSPSALQVFLEVEHTPRYRLDLERAELLARWFRDARAPGADDRSPIAGVCDVL